MTKTVVVTDEAPEAIGPYSQGVVAGPGRIVFVSGQLPVDPATGKLEQGPASAQARKSLENVRAVLDKAGLSMSHVVKTTIFLADLTSFKEVNQVYAEFFDEPYPARATVQVAALPLGAQVEIECIAVG